MDTNFFFPKLCLILLLTSCFIKKDRNSSIPNEGRINKEEPCEILSNDTILIKNTMLVKYYYFTLLNKTDSLLDLNKMKNITDLLDKKCFFIGLKIFQVEKVLGVPTKIVDYSSELHYVYASDLGIDIIFVGVAVKELPETILINNLYKFNRN